MPIFLPTMYKSIHLRNAIVSILVFPWTADAFNVLNCVDVQQQLQHRHHRRKRGSFFSATALGAVAELPPMEKEEEKRRTNGNDIPWIERDGGFIPNLKRRFNRTTKPLQVTDMFQYKKEVVDVDDRIVCVRFYAPWCRSCKAIEGKFQRLAKEYPETEVKFVSVPVTKDNALLHQALGISSLPFAHIYEPTVGLVEERKINKNVFGEFKTILNQYVEGECQFPDEDDQQ